MLSVHVLDVSGTVEKVQGIAIANDTNVIWLSVPFSMSECAQPLTIIPQKARNLWLDGSDGVHWLPKHTLTNSECLFYVFLCFLCVSLCGDHFAMVPLNLTCLHCLQQPFFEHLFNLYSINVVYGPEIVFKYIAVSAVAFAVVEDDDVNTLKKTSNAPMFKFKIWRY